MKNITQHTGTLTIIKREPSSANGNPRYLCQVNQHEFKTPVDSMIAYGITNFDGKPVNIELGTHYGQLTVNSIRYSA